MVAYPFKNLLNFFFIYMSYLKASNKTKLVIALLSLSLLDGTLVKLCTDKPRKKQTKEAKMRTCFATVL